MQYTLIAVQKNGQQIVLAQDAQEHAMNNIRRAAVESSRSIGVRHEVKYRSFFALGTSESSTMAIRFNADGEVISRSAGLV